MTKESRLDEIIGLCRQINKIDEEISMLLRRRLKSDEPTIEKLDKERKVLKQKIESIRGDERDDKRRNCKKNKIQN